MRRIYAGNLPPDTTEKELTELFSEHGTVRSMKLMHDVFTGKCKGFGFIEMEGHEARAAIAGLNGRELRGNLIRVNEERKDDKRGGRGGKGGGRYASGRR
tara:strand:- start:2363 stop:2662 length:300 start_codon:yes stop_codon:yes gene_type:complete